MEKIKTIGIVFITLLFLLPSLVLAVKESGGNSLIASVTPSNPGPGDKVLVVIKGFGPDLGSSEITWQVDNGVPTRTVGQTQFSFFVGPNGSTTKLTVSVVTRQGQKIVKTLTFQPSEMNLIWQAASYIPPFYKGKALPSSNTPVKVIALPTIYNQSGKLVDPKTLIYEWRLDGNSLGAASGLNKNSFIFTTKSDSSTSVISATARDPISGLAAESKINISPIKPQLYFYESKPIEGTDFSKTVSGELSLSSGEATFQAEPFFIPLAKANTPSFEWYVNKQLINNPSPDQSLIVVRGKEGTEGVSLIDLKLSSPSNLFEELAGTFMIRFGNKQQLFNNAVQ